MAMEIPHLESTMYIYIQYIVIQLTVVQLVHFHSYRYQCLPKCWYNERNV